DMQPLPPTAEVHAHFGLQQAAQRALAHGQARGPLGCRASVSGVLHHPLGQAAQPRVFGYGQINRLGGGGFQLIQQYGPQPGGFGAVVSSLGYLGQVNDEFAQQGAYGQAAAGVGQGSRAFDIDEQEADVSVGGKAYAMGHAAWNP